MSDSPYTHCTQLLSYTNYLKKNVASLGCLLKKIAFIIFFNNKNYLEITLPA